MTKLSLQDWLNEGRLRAHKTAKSEMRQLLSVFQRDIQDSRSESISLDRRFATAYSAALTICTAALAASGYRTAGEGHHYFAVQSLAFTLGLDPDTIEKFNRFRRKRNIADYELSALFGRKVDLRTPGDLSRYIRQRVLDEAQVQYAATR